MSQFEDVKNIAIAVAVIGVAAYFRSLNSDERETEEAYEGQINEDALSYADSYYFELAASIEDAFWFWGGVSEDEAQVISDLSQMQTDSDFYKLAVVYGQRCQPFPPILCDPQSLVVSCRAKLDDDDLMTINGLYLSRSMTVVL